MRTIDYEAYLDDDNLTAPATQRIMRKNRRLSQREKRVRQQADLLERSDQIPEEAQPAFNPTFQPARHERAWLLAYMEGFYYNKVITDILHRVKGGKEANVYCCAAHPSMRSELIAAKVYRPRMFRNLRNDARYRQGRYILDEEGKPVFGRREVLAMQKKTRFGRELRQIAWLDAEFTTLQLLIEAGADVPRPLVHNDNVILMEYIGEQNLPGATLNQVHFDQVEARNVFDRLVDNLEIMLSCHRVHGDLSAYNIMVWDGQFKIIDFPQAVDPRRNPEAFDIFQRDVERICQYFVRYRIQEDPTRLAKALWGKYEYDNALDADAWPELPDLS